MSVDGKKMMFASTESMKKSYAVVESLMTLYQAQLTSKGIHSNNDLVQTIAIDFEKIMHALLEVRNQTSEWVIDDLFGTEHPLGAYAKSLLKTPKLFHVGLEVYEPLDVVLYGFEQWIKRSRAVLGMDIHMSRHLRFPASLAFQQRVGAFTEIVRLWLKVDDEQLMLELFDIHRPAQTRQSGTNTRNLNLLLNNKGVYPDHDLAMRKLFADDKIWHYALELQSADMVNALHQEVLVLAQQNPIYRVVYPHPVHNIQDLSYHTKIINTATQTEVEFVADKHH